MVKRINKAKLIKQYIGEVIKEYGFQYAGSQAGIIWLFERQKNGVKQEVYLQEIRFVHMVTMRFQSYTYGWGRPIQPGDYVEKYRNQEFWEYHNEEEYVRILEEFANILKTHGLEMLEKMLVPADPIYPTEEMERKLFGSYSLLVKEAYTRYPFERTGEEAVRKVSEFIYQNKDRDYEEVKDFLIEMAAIYMEICMNDIGGKVALEQMAGKEVCLVKGIGDSGSGEIEPLSLIIDRWKLNHNNILVDENLLLLEYYEFKRGDLMNVETPEMQKRLFESYEKLLEDTCQKYLLETSGEKAVEKLSALIFQKKDEEYEAVKDFLVEMAAVYLKILINDDIADELIFTQNSCEVVKYESEGRKSFFSPLGLVVTWWEQCHFRETSLLILKYREIKG